MIPLKRQAQIVSLLADGHIAKTISVKMGLSIRTVETHIQSIKVKYDAKTIGHLVAIFFREKLIK